MIKDSGIRREFETGAVRDMQEGKGRCNLMPLDVVADLVEDVIYSSRDSVIRHIHEFTFSGDFYCLGTALSVLAERHFENMADMLLEVSVHFEEGAAKYGEHN